MKRYISHSDIAFNVNIKGKRVHIRFDPITRGGSVFSTDNPHIAMEIEKHPDYGILFCSDNSEDHLHGPMQNLESESNKGCIQQIAIDSVQTLTEAKRELCKYGANPSSMRNKAGVLETANLMGIVFPNLV